MRKITFLFISILVIAFVIASPATAQGPEPPRHSLGEGVLPDTLLQDPELGSLWEKYTRLLKSDKISLNDLQNMIASEKSEKAKLLGIVIREPSPLAQAQPAGLCIRPIWGPGKVIWRFSNPGQNGARYSVLPEAASSLVWAQPPKQDIDGIYRASWGNCVAYKIPDSATATFYSAASWEVCYNAFACAYLGHCPKQVNPCDNKSPEGSWPDYPLR